MTVERRFIIKLCTLGILFAGLVLMGLHVRLVLLDRYMDDDLGTFARDPACQSDIVLDGFEIQKQAYPNSCGPTTLSMVRSFLIGASSERDVADKLGFTLGQRGMLPRRFADALQSMLPGFRVRHRTNVRDSELLAHMYSQLKSGFPVPIYFATVNDWNSSVLDTHYSAVIGMRPRRREIVVANAYGYRETMTYSHFLGAAEYHNYRSAPLGFRIGVLFGVIDANNMFLMSRDPGA